MKKVRLNIGSDVCQIKGMINLDIRSEVGPDMVMDIRRLGFKDGCANEINLGNILEHLTPRGARESLAECWRVLDQGRLFVTIPRRDIAEAMYDKGEISAQQLERIKCGEGNGPNSHKTSFKTGDLERLLLDCDFESEPLDLAIFPYIVVSDISNPKPDPWQYGVVARKGTCQNHSVLDWT